MTFVGRDAVTSSVMPAEAGTHVTVRQAAESGHYAVSEQNSTPALSLSKGE